MLLISHGFRKRRTAQEAYYSDNTKPSMEGGSLLAICSLKTHRHYLFSSPYFIPFLPTLSILVRVVCFSLHSSYASHFTPPKFVHYLQDECKCASNMRLTLELRVIDKSLWYRERNIRQYYSSLQRFRLALKLGCI
jgi:hypothetical protein